MNYPAALDTSSSLPNPTAGSNTNSPSHSSLHASENAAIIALETKLGTGASTPASNTLLVGTGAGTSAFQGLTSTQLAAILSDETGSGSAVFANTPTLITPKVDTINESTLNNGVTVGGVNLKSGVVTGSGAGLTAGTTPGTTLAANSVDASKIKWSATGANAGMWWEELGRVTLVANATTMSMASLPLRKYLRIMISAFAVTNSVTTDVRFNGDAGANYAERFSGNGAADSTSNVNVTSLASDTVSVGGAMYRIMDVLNVATAEKPANIHEIVISTGGAGTTPDKYELAGKWVNTTTQINRVDSVITSLAGSYGPGSEIIVLGHN